MRVVAISGDEVGVVLTKEEASAISEYNWPLASLELDGEDERIQAETQAIIRDAMRFRAWWYRRITRFGAKGLNYRLLKEIDELAAAGKIVAVSPDVVEEVVEAEGS